MKRILPFAGWLVAAVMIALSLAGMVSGQGEHGPYIVLYSDGSWEYAPVPSGTPTPETFTPVPTDTPTITPSPTATATPIPLCGGTVTADTLNVRSGPGKTYSLVGQLHAGDRVGILTRVLNASSEWWYLIYEQPMSYVSAQYVRVDADADCPF